MENWVSILSTLCYIGVFSAPDSAESDPFRDVTPYIGMYKELSRCSIPSDKMFTRPMDAMSGKPLPSTFDAFCYYQGKTDHVAHFMCLYYKQIVETYFKDYCEDDSPLKKRLDESAQYKNFASNLVEVSSYLATNLIAGGGYAVFQSAEECLQYCQRSKQSREFCVNFGFALKTALYMTTKTVEAEDTTPSGIVEKHTGNTDANGTTRTEVKNQLQDTTTSGVVEKQTENTDKKDEARTEGENYPQGTAPFVYVGFTDTNRTEKNQPESTTTLIFVEKQIENRWKLWPFRYRRPGPEWKISNMLSRQMVCFIAMIAFLLAISFFFWKSEKRVRKRQCDVNKNKSEKPPSIAYIHLNIQPEYSSSLRG